MAAVASIFVVLCIILHLMVCSDIDLTSSTLPTSSVCSKCLATQENRTLQCAPALESSSDEGSDEGDVCSEDTCPTGFSCPGGRCECMDHPPHVIFCNQSSASILNCFCATQARNSGVLEVGACLYNCGNRAKGLHGDDLVMYSPLPSNASQLGEICARLNRMGRLCGRCKTNHSALAYSFNLTCIPCPGYKLNWLKYIVAAYLPLTLFCIGIVVFRINLVSSHLYALVMCTQVMAMPVTSRIAIDFFQRVTAYSVMNKVILSLYGVWNLDFFRPFYSHICLDMGALPTLALDYGIAMYPLFFMMASYLAITLYDRNYRLVVTLWGPIRALVSRFRKNWTFKTSMIDAFASFFLLSNIKFLSVSFDLLIPSHVYQLNDTHGYNSTLVLYYAADVDYFGKEHLPYALLAVGMLVVFVLMPIAMLILYPFKFFQQLLNVLPGPWYVLHHFMDSFQGCFKDGTEPGTRDCRWFHSVYFICRFLIFFLYGATLSSMFFSVAAIPLMLLTLLIMLAQPFKSSLAHYNNIHAFFAQLLALLSVCLAGLNVSNFYIRYYDVFVLFSIILILTPLGYSVLLVLRLIYKGRGDILKAVLKLRARRRGYSDVSAMEEDLNRVTNPQDCCNKTLDNF